MHLSATLVSKTAWAFLYVLTIFVQRVENQYKSPVSRLFIGKYIGYAKTENEIFFLSKYFKYFNTEEFLFMQ